MLEGHRHLIDAASPGSYRAAMTATVSPPHLKGHRFPREIIAQAVRLSARSYRQARTDAFALWSDDTAALTA